MGSLWEGLGHQKRWFYIGGVAIFTFSLILDFGQFLAPFWTHVGYKNVPEFINDAPWGVQGNQNGGKNAGLIFDNIWDPTEFG